MVEIANVLEKAVVRPVEMVAGGIVLVSEFKRSYYSLPVLTASVLIIYDKMWKRDNKSIWESLTLGWSISEILAGVIVALILSFFGPNPVKDAATKTILGGS